MIKWIKKIREKERQKQLADPLKEFRKVLIMAAFFLTAGITIMLATEKKYWDWSGYPLGISIAQYSLLVGENFGKPIREIFRIGLWYDITVVVIWVLIGFILPFVWMDSYKYSLCLMFVILTVSVFLIYKLTLLRKAADYTKK